MRARLERLRGRLAELRGRTYGEPIPLGELSSLDRAARRTRAVRLLLGASIVAAVVFAFALAPGAQGKHFLPASTVGMVVLDVSGSIKPGYYDMIHSALDDLSRTNQRFGLVVFSDVAYEMLPPGTPAADLKPFLRFFVSNRTRQFDKQGNMLAFTPWEQWFSAGTSISSGLNLAAELLVRDKVKRPSVMLISDLADDPSDYQAVADAIQNYAELNIPLRIVALDPEPHDALFFAQLIGKRGRVRVELPTEQAGRGRIQLRAGFPTWLAVFSAAVIVLLAANELWAEPLSWRKERTA